MKLRGWIRSFIRKTPREVKVMFLIWLPALALFGTDQALLVLTGLLVAVIITERIT